MRSERDGEQEYAHSGFTAMRWQMLQDPANTQLVIQIVTQVKSPENANKFVEDLTPILESCRGKTLSVTEKATGSGSG